MRKYIFCKVLSFVLLISVNSFTSYASKGKLTIDGEKIKYNNKEFKIIGLRCSNALVSDASTTSLINNLKNYKKYGLNSISVFIMGSRFGNVKGYLPDGTMNPIYKSRFKKILKAADKHNMVVIVGCLYWGTSTAKEDLLHWTQKTANTAIANTAQWLKKEKFEHVILDPDNEGMAGKAMKWHTEPMIKASKKVNPMLLVANNTRRKSISEDLNMHFAKRKEGKPWLDSESVPEKKTLGAYWSKFSRQTHDEDKSYQNYSRIGRYTQEMKEDQFTRTLDLINNHSGILFASTWLQCGPLEGLDGPYFSPGGLSNLGSGEDKTAAWNKNIDKIHPEAGVLWWLEFVKKNVKKSKK